MAIGMGSNNRWGENLKMIYYWRVNLDSGLFFGRKAVHFVKENELQNDEAAKAYMFLGVSYFYQGTYDSAINYVGKGLEISEVGS